MPGTPDEKTIAEIKRLRLAGRALDAWALVSEMDPPEQWPARETRVQGARLLDTLGASKRAERLFWREWRRSKGASDLLQDVFWTVLERRGAYLTWKWLLRHAPGASAPADDLSDYEGCLAVALTRLRDFDAAEAALQRGEALDQKERWFQVLRADLLQEQDCREAALDAARAAVKQYPDYATAVRTLAELLVELERVEEALEVLRAGVARLQSKGLAAQLAGLLIERGRMDEAEAALDLHERLAPLMDEELRDWHCGRRCDIASARGDHAGALRQAGQVRQGFYQLVAEKLRAAAPGLRRVLLPVPFVRQHHKTCAPASLTSIARFWGREVGHLDLAEEICHDGTPDHREREWAETHGWSAREFAVTVEAAERLIDAGMPFVMDTVHPGGAHAQVVTGYDQFRTVLFIRDPGNPHTTEFLAAEALARQAPFGPRGFVMVPETESERLAAIELPDTEPHDLLHQTRLRLAEHDRAGARQAVELLRARHPRHRLRWQAELAAAEYDSDHQATLEGLEELLRLFPEVENWQTRRLDLIRELRGREACLEALRVVCAKPDSHPIHWRMLARELHWEAPGIPEARRWLRRVHRARLDSVAILTEANLLWETRDFDNAAPIYRLAACMEEQNEGIWMTWFRAARWTRQPEAALDMLRRRFKQQGATSAAPAVTLYQALDQMNLSHEALAVLEESLRRRPDDADHALYVAGEMLLWNRCARAREILDSISRGARAAADA
ncbi:MAG TPA: C39 family peptidase, partial [Prosthecobacter sp.]|nr:C39 family peptidase [Prosthecobacter sp.]